MTLRARIQELEERVEAIAAELADVRQNLLEALARAIHGPSQPPPILSLQSQDPSENDDADHNHEKNKR